MIRSVVFDFGNVISAFDTGIFLRRLLARSPRTEEALRHAVYGSGLHARYEAGQVTSRTFYETIRHACDLDMSEEEFSSAFADIFTPIESTRSLIRTLSGRYRLGLLSNTNECHFERQIRPADVFPLFDAVTLSCRVGALKPDPPIYRDAVRRLGVVPEECVYIDDIPEYVEGARREGMRGVVFEGGERLRGALASLGVPGQQDLS